MVADDLEQRGAGVAVQNVHCNVVALLLELGLVRGHALNSLLTQLAEKLVLLLGVDREGTRHPRATQHVGRQDGGQEDVATRRDGLVLEQVGKGLVTSLGTIESKQNLALVLRELLTGDTDDLLLTSLGGDRSLVEGVARLQDGGLGNLVDPVEWSVSDRIRTGHRE